MSKKSRSSQSTSEHLNVTVTATFLQDTKSYHKYSLNVDLKDILLSRDHAYLSKDKPVPSTITIKFGTLEDKQDKK